MLCALIACSAMAAAEDLSDSIKESKEDVDMIVARTKQAKTDAEMGRHAIFVHAVDMLKAGHQLADTADAIGKLAKDITDPFVLNPAIRALIKVLASSDVDVRDESCEALGIIGSRTRNRKLRGEAIEALVGMLSDKEAEIREEAAEALGVIAKGIKKKKELDAAIDPLKKAARDSVESVREYAEDALKSLGK